MKNPSYDPTYRESYEIRQMTDAEMTGMTSERLKFLLGIALASIVVGGSIDLFMDRPETWLSVHVVVETLMICGALLMATTLWLGWWRAERSLRIVKTRLETRQAERDVWKANAEKTLQGLARAIDDQFQRWGLTTSEREVAILLLKGYSHKHVARATGRSERTARQHAMAVYQKAGMGSRSELAAYFLEDLMLPSEERSVLGTTNHSQPLDLK
jgi:DNA-binding CsgD family transcriptional regulator